MSKIKTKTINKIKKTLTKREKNKIIAFFLFISPWIIGYLLFTFGPILANIFYSFTDYDAISKPSLIGLDNYIKMFKDDIFWKSLKATAIYTALYVPLSVVGAFLLAVLLNQKIPLLGVWRTIFYLPVVTSGVAVSLLFMWIFQPTYGLVNVTISKVFGIQGPGWFYNEQWAIPATVIMGLWGVGGQMLIYLSGLQSIPTQLYEAAKIDGAGSMKQFLHITIPNMTPIIFYNLVTTIINSFQVFTPSFVITQGGPNYSTYFYVLHLYNSGFKNYKFGYASALANILFLLILLLTFIIFKTGDNWVFSEGGEK